MDNPDPGPRLIDYPGGIAHRADDSRGRDRARPGAEGATAPETLRQKDRGGEGTLESSDGSVPPLAEGARPPDTLRAS